jgi:hypothetical protein
MRQPSVSTLLRLKRATTSSGGARRWLLYTVLFVLVVYIAAASWFAARIVSGGSGRPDDQPQASTESKSEPTQQTFIAEPDEDDFPESKDDGRYTADDIHIVFSTGCNLFQHWQAEVVLYSHMKVGQRGKSPVWCLGAIPRARRGSMASSSHSKFELRLKKTII